MVDGPDDVDVDAVLSMIVRLASTSPWVLLGSGDRFNVQLMKSARRPVKSYVVSFMTALSRAVRAYRDDRGAGDGLR